MERARVIVLAVAVTAALGAAWVARSVVSAPTEVRQVEKTVGATDLLVAAKDIDLGDSVHGDDFKWQQWPVEGVTPGLTTKESQPDAPSELSGAVARAPLIAGEPIKEQKLIKISEGGVMAAILPSGMRAVSTSIREETAAGGFTLPNDRVDVILSYKMRMGSKDEPVSEAVLRNVRVLAIGQTLESANEKAAMRAYDDVRRAMRRVGISPKEVMLQPYTAKWDPNAPLRLSYLEYVVQGPDCPDWSENLARDPQNLPWPNMGCAMQRNLAAMVEDLQDFLYPRAEAPRPSERRVTVWGKYVAGEPTLSKRDPSEHANVSEISQIGSSQ